MSIKVAITHHTKYTYDRPINLSPHIFRLRPAPHCRTKILSYSLEIQPKPHFINWQQDPFGNYQARVVFPEKTTLLDIKVDVMADMQVINPFGFFVEKYAEKYPFTYDGILCKELQPYLTPNESGNLLTQWVKSLDLSEKNIVDFLVYINQKLWKDINYTIRLEPGVQTCEETLEKQLGSCRDSGWLLVQILRHLGLAARFVSGYLIQLTADIPALDGPSGPEADFTDLHAWCEVYIPGAGWIGLDPTSGLFAGEGHIPLSCTPEPAGAAPVTGYTDVCTATMHYENKVTRIHETPRVTKPYSEESWTQIVNLGFEVENQLQKYDVGLTMGGEPTFVSIDDMESAQWNTQADGDHKRSLANTLIHRLKNRFCQGGLLHFGQGKWYPGEELPRWQYALYWRKDQKPMWKNADWLADISKDYGYDKRKASTFIEKLTHNMGIGSMYIHPAYEDVFYYIWSEGKIPANLNPLKKNLKDPLERQYIANLLSEGMNEPSGYVVPLEWNADTLTWETCKWNMRKGNLYLIPGNSPLGLRLPLDQLEVYESKNTFIEQDLFKELPTLSEYTSAARLRVKPVVKRTIRTAICVEVRHGRMHIFLPPLGALEQYLELLNLIEHTAAMLETPVIVEGYEPPKDYRLEKLVVSPDPGVIEVNIQPCKNWSELLHTYEVLFEEARLARLGTEKFMIDGRHTGTGGGNHITLGGAKPADSPLLRKPSLLRSFITYWQHHPGLSYLFSGSFIGPTSQAPRVDEGRDDKLYELEIAFSQIPDHEEVPFWLTDRLLRHFLVDITGNTHRAEFCIDKLYSPDSSSGRLGILELRAFEMPPHYRMCMVQLLLIRSLFLMFWKKPYKGKLVRWGTELHDRFLVPHYCWQDMKDVVYELNQNGISFKLQWLEPFFEFRFPIIGHASFEHINIELRAALEPWHVLGEEMTSRGTARYVDSSLERVQIKVTGLTSNRHIVLCNGKRIPIKSTGRSGEYVGAVRYKAWNPWSSLHPTINAQSPLVFDIYDTWNKRPVAGCTYHVSHPGGRSYDTFPVNSYEAESRRINRFWEMGHNIPSVTTQTQDNVSTSRVEFSPLGSQIVLEDIPEEYIDEEYPYTLDLRKL